MQGIRRWWSQPDHYEWLSGYLAARRLIDVCRLLLGVTMALLAVALGLMMLSPLGPHGIPSRAAVAVFLAGLAAMAVSYAVRWPSRRHSLVFSVLGSVGIAIAALTEPDPLSGLLTCAAFSGLAGYVAFFHGARVLSWTLSVAVLTALTLGVQIAREGDIALAVSKLLLMCGGLLSVPVCGQVLVVFLWGDATKSSTDTLTGLANRRGFRRAAHELVRGVAGHDGWQLIVTMIDLDGFKKLNDEYGHATGDLVLIEVADCLRCFDDENTVVARVGGEEFVAFKRVPVNAADMTAEHIRAAIAATEWGVTASLGVACIEITEVTGSLGEVIDRLVEAADKAMYEAKRAGGNQVCAV